MCPSPGTEAPSPTQSIGTRTLRGMLWAYGSYVGGRLLVLVATAILAHLLSPDDFGVVALALVFTGLLYALRDFGVTQALIVAPEEEVTARADSAFTFSVLLGVALSGIIAALSPLAASFFHEPQLNGLVPLLGLSLLVRSFGTTHYALAQRWLDFRSRTVGEFADVFIRGFASIGLAIAGLGAYSLALGYVIGELALSVTMWVLVPWRPRLRLQSRQLRPLLGFGGALAGVDVLAAIQSNVDYVFVGRVLGVGALGVYTLAFRLPDLIINNLTIVASMVLFPAFALVERGALRYA